MYGEAVIVFNPALRQAAGDTNDPLKYHHKQVMQLASKQRFIAVQFYTLLENDLWKKSSEHSNAMAQLLKQRLELIANKTDKPLIRLTKLVETNAIFLEIPRNWYEPLLAIFSFYMWRTKQFIVNLDYRKMCYCLYGRPQSNRIHKYADINIDIYKIIKIYLGVDEHGIYKCSIE
jgi:threonine aldolase